VTPHPPGWGASRPPPAGDHLSEGEIDHEALLPAELTGAGFVGIVQDLEVCRAGVETAEPDGAGREKTFRLLDTCVRSDVHRDDHLVVDPTKKLRNCFPVWHILPFHSAVFPLPHQIVEEGGELFQLFDIPGFEGTNKAGPILNLRMEGVVQIWSKEFCFNFATLA